jgi:DNA polymerase-3 subunit delta
MVKAKRADIQANLRELGTGFRAVLLYGPNEGLVRERADRFSKQIVDDLADAFNVVRPSGDQVKASLSLLQDEMSAISMAGGRRLVRFEGAGDSACAAVANVLESKLGDGLLVITAGDLGPRSTLRRLAESDPGALAVPCYEDSEQDLDQLIRRELSDRGLSLEPDAAAYLRSNLGSDRMVSRSELAKLSLYMAGRETTAISIEDVRSVVGDSSAWALDDIASAASQGDVRRLDQMLERAEARRESAVSILRALSRRLERLYFVCGLMEEENSFDVAALKLRPPVFFKDKPSFRAQATKWSTSALARALDLVAEAEGQCKSTGLPDFAIASRTCLQIATAAGRKS